MVPHRDFRLLSYFVVVVREGSIRGAAEKLGISPAVVSEALSELERLFDVSLVQRTTRSMRLTDAGRAVFDPAADMVAAAEAALREGQYAAQTPSGLVRITISGELCLSWLPSKLRKFEELMPNVRVEVTVNDDPVDISKSSFDLAVRASFSIEPKGVAGAIGYLPLECVCSPALINRSEDLRTRLVRIGIVGLPAASQTHRIVTAITNSAGRKRHSKIEVPCRFRTSDHVVAHRLAVEGFGAALLIGLSVDEDIAIGRLARVSEEHHFGYAALKVMVRDKHPTAAARSIQDHLLCDG